MEIRKSANGNGLTIGVIGRLETATAAQLESEVNALGADVRELTFDFAALEYVSSAGLRVILQAQKKMKAANALMKIAHVNPSVKKVFDITGFSTVLTFA